MEGESIHLLLFRLGIANMSLVDPVPIASHQVSPVMAPIKPATQAKKAAAKEKGVSQPVTQPRAQKVMHIISPTPGVQEVVALPIPGPSREAPLPLFEVKAISGDGDVGGGVPTSSSEWP